MLKFVKRKTSLLLRGKTKKHVGVCSLLILTLIPGLVYGVTSTYSKNSLAYGNNNVEVYEISSSVPLPLKKPVMFETQKSFQVAMIIPEDHQKNITSSVSFSRQDHKEAKIAAEIFAAQDYGDIIKANEKLRKIKSKELRGHILAERFLVTDGYVSSPLELQQWLKFYHSYPQAERIYKLAIRKGASASSLKKPQSKKPIIGNLATISYHSKTYQSKKKRSEAQTRQYLDLKHSIRLLVQTNEPTKALNLINEPQNTSIMDDVEYDLLRADVASGYLYSNRLNHALRLANASIKRSGDKVPQAGWIKGLVTWQTKDYQASYEAFKMAANSDYSNGWLKSSASYWASRAAMRSGNKKQVRKLVQQAASYPHSFYGVIANYALGEKDPFNWETPRLSNKHLDLIHATNIGRRALFLIEAGRFDLAQRELIYMNIKNKPHLKEALIALSQYYNLADLSLRLGNAIKPSKGSLYDAALYPDATWTPKNGYKVDRALINAIIKQESRFQAGAKNPSGATGLMQLMPRTADYILSKTSHKDAKAINKLHKPEINLEFGQTYLHYLLNHKAVGQDLFSMAIAYNAGPGNLSKWKRERANMTDPLLFIETIPFHETRAFVDRVMANYWIYRIRYNQKTPSLNDVAEGRWARYIAQDRDIVELASR